MRASARNTAPPAGASEKPPLPALTMMQKAVCVKATNAAVFALAVQAAEPTTECIRDGGDFVALALSTPRHIANYDEVCTRTIAKALEFQVRNTYFVNEDVLKAGQYHLGIVASNLFRLGRAAADAAKKGFLQRCRDDAAASKAEHATLLKILKTNAFHAAIDSGGTWAPYQGPPRKGCMISPLTAQGLACWRLRGAAGLGEESAVMPEQIGA